MNWRSVPAFAASASAHIVAGTLVWVLVAAPSRTVSPRRQKITIAAFVVAPPEDPKFAGLNPVDPPEDWAPRRRAGRSAVSIGTFTFDIDGIADRAQVLFPFLTPGLSLEHFTLAAQRDVRDSLADPFAPPNPGAESAAEKGALVLSDRALQALIDQSWSRRNRWTPFRPIVRLAETHNADTGRLPNLLQGYREQNWLQPYADTTIHDPRLWTELSLAAGHVDFVGFIRRYASEHPSTKATTELLFLLDNMAQASRQALADLLDTDPNEDLVQTRQANRHAYDLIVDLRYHYARELHRRGLAAREAFAAHYDKVRLAILTGILRTTPKAYRAGDARFLIGAIYWQQRHIQDALVWWRRIAIDPTDSYVVAYSDILRAIRRADARSGVDAAASDQALRREINQVLDVEHERWLRFSMERLRRFGYRLDTF